MRGKIISGITDCGQTAKRQEEEWQEDPVLS